MSRIVIKCINSKKIVDFELKDEKLGEIIIVFFQGYCISSCWYFVDYTIKVPSEVKY